MSTHWHLYCLDCGEKGGTCYEDSRGWNRAEDAVAALLAHRHAIAAMAPTGLRIEHGCGEVDAAWFAAHLNHRVRVRSEYGEILGTCARPIECACCGSDWRLKCGREPGHEGPCSAAAGEDGR